MQTPNGQTDCPGSNRPKSIRSTESLNSKEEEFLGFIKLHGIEEFVCSLKRVHDLALYYTDLSFEIEEKGVLWDIKILWESLEQLNKA